MAATASGQHLQAVEGVREVVEIYQDDYAAHVYRLMAGGSWAFEALGGEDAVLRLESLGIEVPLAEICALVSLPRPSDDVVSSWTAASSERAKSRRANYGSSVDPGSLYRPAGPELSSVGRPTASPRSSP